jgi:hypothetical protein
MVDVPTLMPVICGPAAGKLGHAGIEARAGELVARFIQIAG